MKKTKLLLVLSSAALAFGGAMLVVSTSGVHQAQAATFLNGRVTDDFAQGIDPERYDVVGDEGNKFHFTERQGMLTMANLNYNSGYARTKEKITVDEGQNLVLQYDSVSDSVASGFECIWKGADDYATAWGDMPMFIPSGNQYFVNGATSSVCAGPAANTQWQVLTNISTGHTVRMVFNADGSQFVYGKAFDETDFSLVAYGEAGKNTKVGTGYVGFMGNGMGGTLSITNFKAGTTVTTAATDNDGGSPLWQLEDDFQTSDHWEVSSVEGGGSATISGPAKYLSFDDPASGAGIVTKNSYSKAEGTSKFLTATVDLSLGDLVAGKAIGLTVGASETNPLAGTFVGLEKGEDGNGLIRIAQAGVAGETVALGAPIDNTNQSLKVAVTINEEGKYVVTGSVGAISNSVVVDDAQGKVAIAALGATGSVTGKILGLTIDDYKSVIENGRSVVEEFEAPLNHNYFIAQSDVGQVEVKDGVLHFNQTGDGALFGTKYRYANFDLSFDYWKQQLEEDDEGNIKKASTWLGISFGRDNIDDPFWAETDPMVYIQNDTWDPLNLTDGARLWLLPEYQFTPDDLTSWLHAHIVAVDGTVKVYVSTIGGDEYLLHTYENVDTAGYIALCGTAGADFKVDNFKLTNLDGNEVTNAIPVAQDHSFSVVAGETLTDRVIATDEDDETLTYEVVEDNTTAQGLLTFHADGTFTFEAKEDAVAGDVTFTYKAFDTEDYSETKTVTIAITAKGGSSSEEPTSSETPVDTSQEPTSSGEGGKTSGGCGGCGGVIAASGAALAIALGATVAVALKRKHDDK